MIGSFLSSIINSVLTGSCVVLNLSAYPSFPNLLDTYSGYGLDPPSHGAFTSTTLMDFLKALSIIMLNLIMCTLHNTTAQILLLIKNQFLKLTILSFSLYTIKHIHFKCILQ